MWREEGRRKGWGTKDSGIRKKKRGDRRTSDRAAAVSKSPNKAEHARVEQGAIERTSVRTRRARGRATATLPLCAPSFCFVKHMLMPEEQERGREKTNVLASCRQRQTSNFHTPTHTVTRDRRDGRRAPGDHSPRGHLFSTPLFLTLFYPSAYCKYSLHLALL